MKKIIFLLISLLFFLTGGAILGVHAQTPSTTPDSSVAKYHITFPIPELGNCTSVESCKEYCDDSSHQDACVAYAKEKGFYKDNTDQTVLSAAENELGCNSLESCKTFCEESANHIVCQNFAKEHNLTTSTDPSSNTTLQKAKEVLGCDSLDSCKAFCSDEANQQKCSEFAQENGLKGGREKVGPGGCTNQTTCSTYCSDPNHRSECQQFSTVASPSAKPISQPLPTNYDLTEYPSYTPVITKYPTPDHILPSPTSLPPTSPTLAFYQNYCNSHPNCTWTDNHCQCQPISIPFSTPTPTPTYIPPTSPTIAFYAQYCNSHPNCTWTDNQCKCVTNTSAPTPTPSVKGVTIHRNILQVLFDLITGKL